MVTWVGMAITHNEMSVQCENCRVDFTIDVNVGFTLRTVHITASSRPRKVKSPESRPVSSRMLGCSSHEVTTLENPSSRYSHGYNLAKRLEYASLPTPNRKGTLWEMHPTVWPTKTQQDIEKILSHSPVRSLKQSRLLFAQSACRSRRVPEVFAAGLGFPLHRRLEIFATTFATKPQETKQ